MARIRLSRRTSRCPAPRIEDRQRAELVSLIVAHTFNVTPVDLRMPTRQRGKAAVARQVAMYICHVTLGQSFRDVGEFFGRDRTTAAYACKVVECRRDQREFDDLIRRIEVAVRVLGVAPPARVPTFGGL